jgi:hypothetical protein
MLFDVKHQLHQLLMLILKMYDYYFVEHNLKYLKKVYQYKILMIQLNENKMMLKIEIIFLINL